MRFFKCIALVAGLLFSAVLNAQTISNAYTYSGLSWSMSTSTSGLAACTDLLLDATGDIYNSDNYAVYGQLYCPALGGGYASSGNAYFDSLGSFHMTVSLGVTYQMVCDNINGFTLSGSCPIYNYLGAQMGTAFITFY